MSWGRGGRVEGDGVVAVVDVVEEGCDGVEGVEDIGEVVFRVKSLEKKEGEEGEGDAVFSEDGEDVWEGGCVCVFRSALFLDES